MCGTGISKKSLYETLGPALCIALAGWSDKLKIILALLTSGMYIYPLLSSEGLSPPVVLCGLPGKSTSATVQLHSTECIGYVVGCNEYCASCKGMG